MYAALIFFTRLPWWRWHTPPQEDYKRVVVFLTWVGWLTALVMVGVWWIATKFLPPAIAILLSMIARLILTGALHEDGLADTLDGMGGGTSRKRILMIMKDSQIGAYGVIGLVLYFLLFGATLLQYPIPHWGWIIFAADPIGRLASAELTNRLPYARTEEASKAGVVYSRMNWRDRILSWMGGGLPLVPLAIFVSPWLLSAILAPIFVYILGHYYLKRRIGGYTGDCCGALQLVAELSFLLAVLSAYSLPAMTNL